MLEICIGGKMIHQVHFKNVQKHKDLTLNFIEGLNVITGSTDSGKTSLLRGLLFALNNRGTSDKLLTWNAKEGSVEISIDGNQITRSFGKENAYYLNGERFTAFRKDVPAPISSIVNMDNINIQNRRDMPFMVYATASSNAEQFSTMLDLTEIQNTVDNLKSKVKKAKEKKEVLDEKLKSVEKELEQYSELETASKRFSALCERADKLSSYRNRATELAASLQEIQLLSKRLYEQSAGLTAHEKFKGIIYSFKELSALKTQANSLKTHFNKLKSLHQKVKQSVQAKTAFEQINKLIEQKQIIDKFQEKAQLLKKYQAFFNDCNVKIVVGVKAVNALKEFSAIKLQITHMQIFKDKFAVLKQAQQKLLLLKNKVITAEKQLEQAEKDWSSIQNKVCPLCGNIIGNCEDSK